MLCDRETKRTRAAQLYSPRRLTEGERWTREALWELRRGKYRPAAWLRLLRSSLERSSATRRHRPALTRQARAWGASGAIAWVLACRAARPVRGITLRPVIGLLWWLAVWKMLEWHLGMIDEREGRFRTRLSRADGLSLVRFWLVPVVPGVAHSPAGLPAVILLGGATDWLDGRAAHRYGHTRLGRDLDTTADLAFLTTVAVSARAAARITPLGFWALGARHALGVAVSLGAAFSRGRHPAISARRWGALPRVAGLGLCASRFPRVGTAVLVLGCLVPPRLTAGRRPLGADGE